MVKYLTVLAAALLVASPCHGDIALNPSILTFDEKVTVTTLSFTCENPRPWTNRELSAMYMERNGVKLGSAGAHSPPVLSINTNGASIKGNINHSITITMTQASCRDGGEYVCLVERGPSAYRVSQKLEIVVKPGRTVAMTASPHKPEYFLNDTVQLSCSGLIGSSNLFLEILWIWEYMDYGQNESWKNYTDSKIANDPPVFINISCQNRQVSNIFRTLTLEDNRRTYRCYITWKGIVYTEKAAIYVFTIVHGSSSSEKMIVTAIPSKVRQPEADVVAWWIIVVAVVGGVILCLVIVIVILLLRRCQRNGDEHIPDKNKYTPESDDETSNVPTISVVQGRKTHLHLDSVPEKESGLASDRESAVDVSESAVNASSRGSQ